MKNKSELIIPVLVLLLLAAVPSWILYKYTGDLLLYETLHDRGIETTGAVKAKGIIKSGQLIRMRATSESDDHRVFVSLQLPHGISSLCSFRVSKDTYDVITKRDSLNIIYLPDDPSKCTLPNSLGINRLLLISLIAVAVFLLLLSAGFIFYIYNSFRKPPADKPVPLTTYLGIADGGLDCPKCGAPMTEGYMPTVGGVSWRDRRDPVGIPTMLNGLPGTTFCVKRPKLHAYRCETCCIIIFRYGA
ncbi:MAG: PF20097 family protein [Thermodesulfobacteriota bacterium]